LVASNVARQIEGRVSYRRAVKAAIANTMRMGAEGIKVMVSGRLGGAEIARREQFKEGRIPLHTLRADIDYARDEAHTTYGRIGIKVWICRGEIYGRPDFFNFGVADAKTQRQPRGGSQRPRSRKRK